MWSIPYIRNAKKYGRLQMGRKKCSICHQIGHNWNNCPDKPVDEQTATPAKTAPDAQTAEISENAPTVETQTTQPPRNEVESQAVPLPTPKEPSQ